MKQLIRYLALILALASFWAVGGYIIGAAIEFIIELIGGEPYSWSTILASINIIIGMLLFKGVIQDPTAERLFFEGPSGDGEGDFRIGCLWAIPIVLLLLGLYTWSIAILLRLFTSR